MANYRYCTFCDKRHRVNMDYGEYDVANIGKNEGKVMCYEQVSYEREYATPVFHVMDGDRYGYKVGTNLMESDENGSDIWGMPSALVSYCKTLTWHSSNAWRGAVLGKAPEGWVSVLDTWFGSLDGYNLRDTSALFQKAWERSSSDRYNDWSSGVDLEMIVSFPRTSNVCSCGLEVYIPDNHDQREAFALWLAGDEAGRGYPGINEMRVSLGLQPEQSEEPIEVNA